MINCLKRKTYYIHYKTIKKYLTHEFFEHQFINYVFKVPGLKHYLSKPENFNISVIRKGKPKFNAAVKLA